MANLKRYEGPNSAYKRPLYLWTCGDSSTDTNKNHSHTIVKVTATATATDRMEKLFSIGKELSNNIIKIIIGY